MYFGGFECICGNVFSFTLLQWRVTCNSSKDRRVGSELSIMETKWLYEPNLLTMTGINQLANSLANGVADVCIQTLWHSSAKSMPDEKDEISRNHRESLVCLAARMMIQSKSPTPHHSTCCKLSWNRRNSIYKALPPRFRQFLSTIATPMVKRLLQPYELPDGCCWPPSPLYKHSYRQDNPPVREWLTTSLFYEQLNSIQVATRPQSYETHLEYRRWTLSLSP